MFSIASRRVACITARSSGVSLSKFRFMSSLPSTMKAAVVRETGDAHALKIETDFPTPEVKAGGVIVKNQYAGINFIDTYHRKGLYARDLPFVGGQEGGGTVAEVSDEAAAQGIKVGDRVAYSVFGTYAEYTAVPAAKLLPVPDEVSLDVATSCVVQGLTAHYLTTSAHADLIKEGEWCLIHGVGGGTCQWAAQMAKIRGYKVIGTCSKGKEDISKAVGCDELIVLDEVPGTAFEDYESKDIVAKVMEVTDGKGVKAVIDGIGKSTVDISINSLAHRGIFVSFGNASGAVPAFPVLRLIGKSAYVTRPKLLDYTTMNTVVRKSAVVAARATRPVASKQQKRGIVDWMTSYPDKVMATKKVQMTGGTCQGEMNPTWWKQPGDALPLAVGASLIAFGGVNCVIGHYRLATGTGKMDL